ncbi:MAG: hypothetical protein JWN08_2230 [Frankiales bacterium]|nr:hypothetical protein [Frankiales bacterium]
MTTPTASATTAATTTSVVQACCRRTMSSIEVTARGVTLVLHSCTACGRHVWERDGVVADRAELLDGVRTFLEQPRIPTPRKRRTPA